MAPVPGDPFTKPSASLDEPKLEDRWRSTDLHYRPINHDERFHAILSMDEYQTDEKKIRDAVLFCKEKVDSLKMIGYPLFTGLTNTVDFDESVRQNAFIVDDFFDSLITKISIRQESLYQKLRVLIAQGESYETFKKMMKDLDFSLKCNEIWENDSVAYRCNTCALTPCMSLCAACFQSAGHEDHDFTRFFSREGGACDCGNADVIKSDGFCHRHGENAVRPPSPSPLIVSLPEYIMVKLIVRLFLDWRGWMTRYTKAKEEQHALNPDQYINLGAHCENEMRPSNMLISFLQECVNYGGPMREAMSKILLDRELYKALTERNSSDIYQDGSVRVDVALDWRTRGEFEKDRWSIYASQLQSCFPGINPDVLLRCECLLDELLFWVIRMNFPQNLINFCLSMLSEPDYTNTLSRRFFAWYPLVANCVRELCIYQKQHDRLPDIVQNTCSRVIHISVQMLSSEALCRKLNDECDLVNMILSTVFYLLTENLERSNMTLDPMLKWCGHAAAMDNLSSEWEVIVLENNAVISQHGYWFVMGDMQNLLAHFSLAVSTILHPSAFVHTYVNLLCRMQGMNMNWRIVRGEHRENDASEPVHRSFTLEFETLAITMFNFIAAIHKQESVVAAITFFDRIVKAVEQWLDTISGWATVGVKSCPAYAVSFHIPLHRHLSTALSHFNDMEDFRKNTLEFQKNEPLLRKVLLHPMKIQVSRAEYYAGMWVRNGNQLRVQAIIYANAHINASFQTPDIDIIRYCAANVDADWFIEALIASFHLDDVFSLPDGDINRLENVNPTVANDLEVNCHEMDLTPCENVNSTVYNEKEIEALYGVCMENILESMENAHRREHIKLLMNSNNVETIDFVWNEDNVKIVSRQEWIDPLLSAALRLLCELVVILVNCGASVEEAMRTEMINCLAMEEQTHSRLRSAIAEKGSRGADIVDQMFDDILNQIADFSEPEATPGGQMHQGSYQLKSQVWFSEFCPVFCQMRALTPKYSATVMMDVEKLEREMLGPEQKIPQLWIPYQLSNFKQNCRHSAVEDIGRILLSNRFFQLSLIVLWTSMKSDYVRDNSVQLIIYLLTLAVQYASNLPPAEREAGISKFRTLYRTTGSSAPINLQSVLYILFARECDKRGNKREMVQKVLTHGELNKQRIIGGEAEYIGRLLSMLCEMDKDLRLFLACCMRDCELNSETRPQKEGNEKTAILERKLAAKRRVEALFAANRKKNSDVMKRLMDKEGMTQKEVDLIDTSQPDIRLFECPICGDLDTPSTLQEPMGMLVKVGINWIAENCLSTDEPELDLLQLDDNIQKSGVRERKMRKFWRTARKELTQQVPLYSDLLDCSTGIEIKTCGHTAHIKCFNVYRETIRNDLRVPPETRLEVSCPLCRFTVNGQLPLCVDWEFQTSSKGPLENDNDKAFDALMDCIVFWKKTFTSSNDQSAYTEHFITNMVNIMNCQFWEIRHEDGIPVRGQTIINAAIKGIVERCMLLNKLSITERRKNTRALITEHLIPASVVRTSERNVEMSLCAAKDLFLPKMFSPPLLNDNLIVSDDDLIDVVDLHADDLCALQSTSARERVQQRSLCNDPSYQRKFLNTPSPVPLLLFDLKSLFVSLSVFIIDNQRLSKEDKRQLCRVLSRRILSATIVKTLLCLLLRCSRTTLERLVKGQQIIGGITGELSHLPLLIAEKLSSNVMYFNSVLEMMDDEWVEDVTSFPSNFKWQLLDTINFIAEFWRQTKILPKIDESIDILKDSSIQDALNGIGSDISSVIPDEESVSLWLKQFGPSTLLNYKTPHKALTREPLSWRPFLLLDLPEKYDTLFSRYFHRPCINCDKVPQYPLVCLLCSQLVCLDDCCRLPSTTVHEHQRPTFSNEVERHTMDCGSGICCYAALNSSLMVVVCKRLATLWGSVYLDIHGEEDRNLRRGKPLFLSERRMRCLLSDWADQEWDRTRQWLSMVSLRDQLKDAHLAYR